MNLITIFQQGQHVQTIAVGKEDAHKNGNKAENTKQNDPGVEILITREPSEGEGDGQPPKAESSTHSPTIKRKTEDKIDGYTDVRPKVVFKEVVVIPEGHIMVKISEYQKLQLDLRNSNESVEELSSR